MVKRLAILSLVSMMGLSCIGADAALCGSIESKFVMNSSYNEQNYEDSGVVNITTPTSQEIVKENVAYIDNATSTNIQNKCGASESFVSTVVSNYNRIPNYVRNTIEGNNWKVEIVTLDYLKNLLGINNSILGFTDIETKTIYVTNREGKADKTIIHEVGHAYDRYFNWITDSSEFENLFETERDNFCSFHKTHKANTSTEREFFAEAFMVYVTNPSKLYEKCPNLYNFIDSWATGSVFH